MLVSWNRTWIRNLHEPLLDLGHDVVLLDAAEGWQAMQRRDARACARFSDRVVDAFRREHRRRPFDLFFAYLMDGMIEPSAIDQIRRMGVLTCNFSCNNVHQFDLVDGLAPHFDVNLHAERVARAKFVAIGANALWWQMGSNPLHFHPRPLARTIPVSFVGANYALRARYVARLLEAGIDVHAFGPSWQYGSSTRMRSFGKRWVLAVRAIAALDLRRRAMASAELADHDQRRALAQRFPGNLHAPVSDEALVDLYARSHVSLGFLEVYEGHAASAPVLKHLHLREFEAPMCGALLVTGPAATSSRSSSSPSVRSSPTATQRSSWTRSATTLPIRRRRSRCGARGMLERSVTTPAIGGSSPCSVPSGSRDPDPLQRQWEAGPHCEAPRDLALLAFRARQRMTWR